MVSGLYDHESVTYRAVFGEFYNIRSGTSANRIILATRGPLPSVSSLKTTARSLSSRLRRYNVQLSDYIPALSAAVDWDTEARVLTDQYAPVDRAIIRLLYDSRLKPGLTRAGLLTLLAKP